MRIYSLGFELTSLGYEVTFVCPHENRNLRTEVREISANSNLILLPRLTYRTRYIGTIYRAIMILLILRKKKFDILHVCAPSFPETWIVTLFGKIRNIPLLVDIDDLWGIRSDENRWVVEAMIEEILTRSALSFANRIITASSFLKQRYKSLTKTNIEVLWNGVEKDIFSSVNRIDARNRLLKRFGLSSETKIVLTHNGEKIALISAAVRELRNSGMNVVVLLIGGLPTKGSIRMEKHISLHEGMYATSLMDRSLYIDFLAGSDVILFLMEDSNWDMYRFPIKLTEFLVSGTPMVCYPVGETRTVLDAAGYDNRLYTKLDERTIALSLKFCFENESHVAMVVGSAKNFALQNLTWEILAKKLSTIYQNMINYLQVHV